MYYNLCLLLLLVGLYSITACKSTQKTSSHAIKQPIIDNKAKWTRNLSVYEINIRQYSKEGTFAAVEADLPRLSKMGVGILWFMPITPIGEKGRKGTMGSHYAVKDYMATNPDYGTVEEFAQLVSKAHGWGMHVIIDWVGNHTAWDNALAQTNPTWYTKDAKGDFQPPVADWSDVIDLDYNNPELRKYMISAMQFWVSKCNIDGFRVDVAEMVPTDFWEQARRELDKTKPLFWLAEGEKAELHKYAFDATYGWEMHHLLKDVAQGTKNISDIYNYIDKNDANFPEDAYRLYFTTNHDENSWNGTEKEKFGDGAQAFFVLCATVPMGMPLIYNAQESKLDKRLAFFDKDPIEWHDYPLQDFYTALIQLKKNNKALQNGAFGGKMTKINDAQNEVMVYTREKDGDKVLVMLNLSGKNKTVKLNNQALKGSYTNLFDKSKKNFNSQETITLRAWEYQVWVK